MERDPAWSLAKKHVKTVRDFFYHLMVDVVMLIIIDLRQSRRSSALTGPTG